MLDFNAKIGYYKNILIGAVKRKQEMEEPKIEDKLNELLKEFDAVAGPEEQKLASLARQASDNCKKLRKSMDSLQESLDYLRLCIKYQLFDLEATRRENKHLRNLLEKKKEEE